MALQLEITSDNKSLLGDDYLRVFRADGGTIGRALQNDWILPDPDRFISGRHATIDHQGGSYYLADTSSNGVYVNDEDEPLGRGNPRRLFNGDRLRMGSYEFLVKLDEGEGLEMPPPPKPTVVPDHIEQLVPEDVLHSSIMLLDEEAITGDDEFKAALVGDTLGGRLKEKGKEKGKPKPTSGANPLHEPEKPPGISANELLEAFLKSAGVNQTDIHPSVDPLELMTNAGQVLREMVSGLNDLLVCRTSLKSMFRLDKTTVLPHRNNPLKLSASTSDSIKQLLVGKDGEYLGPLDSITEVCQDLKFHHDAMIGGMTSALHDFVGHFDPDQLKDSFDKTLSKKSLMGALNKLKYWELYCDLYPILTQQGAGDLPQRFGEDFVRHYEQFITEYKRGGAGALKSTVTMRHKSSRTP